MRLFPLGQMRLPEVTTGHLETFYRALAARYSKSVVQHVRIFINLSLRHAVRNGHLLNHPGLLAELPRMESKPVAQVLESADLQRLLEVSTGTRWEALMYFAVSLGLRHGELLGLQWGDLDRERAGIQVQRSVGVDKIGAVRVGPLKTTTSNRMAYLDDHHFALLEQMRAEQQETGFPLVWLFPSLTGGPLNQQNVRREYRKFLVRAGISPTVRIHDLRHTFTTMHIMGGTDPKTTSSLVGHKDTRFTLNIYTHVSEERKKATAARTASVLGLKQSG